MRRVAAWLGLVAVCATAALSRIANAQLPVCAPPAPADPYYTVCAPGGRLLATRLLSEFSIDHILKGGAQPFGRRAGDTLRSIASTEWLEKNAAVARYIDGLDPFNITKIDTSTGMLDLVVSEELQRFASSLEIKDETYDASLRLPTRIGGGYWRTPGVLQIAFWEGKRAALTIGAPNGVKLDAEIECLVISTDAIRVLTAGDATPDILVLFEQCE